jgi:hypothetical protein
MLIIDSRNFIHYVLLLLLLLPTGLISVRQSIIKQTTATSSAFQNKLSKINFPRFAARQHYATFSLGSVLILCEVISIVPKLCLQAIA